MAYKEQSPLPIVEGGTNAKVMTTTDGVVYFDGTRLVTTGAGTSNQVLTSNGSASAPTFQSRTGTGKAVIGTSTLIVAGGGGGGPKQWQSPFMSGTPNGNQAAAQMVCPVSGTLSSFYVLCSQNTYGNQITVTVNINSTNSALVVTIPTNTTGTFTDLIHSASVTAGDLLQFETTPAGGGAPPQLQACYALVLTD